MAVLSIKDMSAFKISAAVFVCLLGRRAAAETVIVEKEIAKFPINLKSPASKFVDEINILQLLNVSNKISGVSLVEGPIVAFPAYKFRLPYDNGPLSNGNNVVQALNSKKGFTIVFLYRQQKNNLGTLLSINSPGRLTPWLQFDSNSKLGLITLKYRLNKSPKLRQVEWSLPIYRRKIPLAAWTWVSVSVDLQIGVIHFDLDCEPSQFESLWFGDRTDRISIPHEALVYFRQEPGRKKKFLGSIQVAKVIPYVADERRLWSCVQISQDLNSALRKPVVIASS